MPTIKVCADGYWHDEPDAYDEDRGDLYLNRSAGPRESNWLSWEDVPGKEISFESVEELENEFMDKDLFHWGEEGNPDLFCFYVDELKLFAAVSAEYFPGSLAQLWCHVWYEIDIAFFTESDNLRYLQRYLSALAAFCGTDAVKEYARQELAPILDYLLDNCPDDREEIEDVIASWIVEVSPSV